MKVRNKILLALLLALLTGLVGFKVWRAFSKSETAYWKCFRDLQYVPGSNNPFQSLDLYLPRKAEGGPVPLIVWIHGGAWMSGDKNHAPLPIILDRGYAVASLNYRLTTTDLHPAQIYDCKAALRFLRAHAAEYKVDPARIGVWGHSAGGHLAALLGTSGDVKELEGDLGNKDISSRVQAVVDWAGPTDFVTCALQAPPNCRIDFKSPSNPIAALMGPNQSPTAYLAASPIQYVSGDDPPFLILHAQDDDVVPVKQAIELSELLKMKKVKVRSHISTYGGHGLFKPEFVNETMDFFDENLGEK